MAGVKPQRQKIVLGDGPIEQLWRAVEQGVLPLDTAIELAAGPEIKPHLAMPYVAALSMYCVRDAVQSRQPLRSMVRMQVVRGAVKALPDGPPAREMADAVDLDWVELVHFLLVEVADGRLYRDALAVGERLVANAEARKDNEAASRALFRLATLNLDPYVVGRQDMAYEASIQDWQRTFIVDFGTELEGLSPEDYAMPSPAVALKRAEGYLRRTVNIAEGDTLPRARKALVQVLEWRDRVLKEPVDRTELVALCRSALEVLDPAEYPHQRAGVLGVLARYDQEVAAAETLKLFEISFDEYLARHGALLTIDLAKSGVRALGPVNPAAAARLLDDAAPLLSIHGTNKDRSECWMDELTALGKSNGHQFLDDLPEGGLGSVAQQLRERAAVESWDRARLATGLITLAAQCSKWDAEVIGLDLMAEAEATAPLLVRRHREALTFLNGVLYQNVGVNHYRRGEFVQAVGGYGRALATFVGLRLPQSSRNCLEMIEDLARRATPQLAVKIVEEIAPLTLKLGTLLGDTATRIIERLADRSIAAAAILQETSETINFLTQVAKGQRFGAMLDPHPRPPVEQDPEAAGYLRTLSELPPAEEGVLLDEDLALTAFAERRPQHEGRTAAELRANVEHAFDARVSALMLGGVGEAEPRYLTCDQIRQFLDDRTILLNLYVGALQGGRAPVYALIFTREHVEIRRLVWEWHPEDAPPPPGTSATALAVATLRRALAEEPREGRTVSRAAAGHLAGLMRPFLADALPVLERLRRDGKDCLCIVPHGPLHFCPFHLLRDGTASLASRWTITYLPNLNLLGRVQPARRRHTPIASLGLSFEENHPLALEPMPQSRAEAEEVARVFGATALVESAATRAAARRALEDARFVHISTHGLQRVEAPALQALFLSPDEQSDGRLFAYELPSLDLVGLELVTLSACETALGRFDLGDNLRGMPAGFLMAGADALVGTLWPAEVNASRLFFVSLYRALRHGLPLRDAFGTAQRQTRRRFPAARDWGPFYLMGGWDGPAPLATVKKGGRHGHDHPRRHRADREGRRPGKTPDEQGRAGDDDRR